jgi:hypothetical protein
MWELIEALILRDPLYVTVEDWAFVCLCSIVHVEPVEHKFEENFSVFFFNSYSSFLSIGMNGHLCTFLCAWLNGEQRNEKTKGRVPDSMDVP